jgi:hypothetical protein
MDQRARDASSGPSDLFLVLLTIAQFDFLFLFLLLLYFYLLGRFPGRLSEIPAANNVTWANPMNRSRYGPLRRCSNKRKIEALFYPFFIRFVYLMLRQLKIAHGFVNRLLEGIIFVIGQKIERKYSFHNPLLDPTNKIIFQ